MNIENALEDQNIEVLVEFGERGKRRPDRLNVIEPNEPGATVQKEKSITVKFDEDDRFEDEFKLFIKIARVPNRNGILGVGFAPGKDRKIMNKTFFFHHLEMTTRGSEINLMALYYLTDTESDVLNHNKNHKDPTVIHPDEPGGSVAN